MPVEQAFRVTEAPRFCELLGLSVQDAFQLAGKGERSSQETCCV